MTESALPAMSGWLHPSLLLMAGALFVPLLRDRSQQVYRVLLALAFAWAVFSIAPGTLGAFRFLGLDIVTGRADTLGLLFTSAFALVTVIATVYALHVRDDVQHVAAFFYAAATTGVALAGDLITLYVFWEVMMLASVWLIWRRCSPTSFAAGMRYLLVHAAGGMLLLAGIVFYYHETGSIAFTRIDVGGPAFTLILLGILVNAAVPPLHAWLTDAYPEATVTGAIFLSALTTKAAVYTLMRAYPGTELLVWLGAVMALWGVVYAVLANDMRRLLAYSIISQVGYMVAAVGMGTPIALNGAAAHAFTHILYKALLFMSVGAIIHATGRSKLTELGGLYRSMPWTFVLYLIGALSISAFPLFSGFISKTMVIEAAALDHRAALWLMLSVASVGTFIHTGLKLPYLAFFGDDRGLRPTNAPRSMFVAMGLAALLCIVIGVDPAWLYARLPFPADYDAYTVGHVLWELQLLLFAGLGFFVLRKYVRAAPNISLDSDWLYRRALPRLMHGLHHHTLAAWHSVHTRIRRPARALLGFVVGHGPSGLLARSWPTGSMVLWVAVILAGSLLMYYF